MISKPQREMFDKISDGKLTAKQKGDFYFRMSKVLMKRLDELETICSLLDKIPLSYQDKIDFQRPAICAMDITEKLVERLDPAYPSPIIKDSKGNECDIREAPPEGEEWNFVGRRVVRHFTINIKGYLPGVADTDATLAVAYEPDDQEIAFLHRLTDHRLKMEKIREESARSHRRYTQGEIKENILPGLKKRGKNFDARIVSIVGDYIHEITEKESIEQFARVEEMVGIDLEKS